MAIDPGYEGFGDLGEVLLGGNRGRAEDAFLSGATKTAALDSALATARMKRDKLIARQKIREQLPPGPEGDLIAALINAESGSDFSAATTGIGHMQENQARQRALDAPRPGTDGYTLEQTPDDLTQSLMIATGKLPTASNIALGQQVQAELEKDRATAAATNARAGASNAMADASTALAERRRRPAEPRKSKGSMTGVEGEVDGTTPTPAATTAKGKAPPEGSKVRGPDGKIYVVRNGEPVLVK